MPCAITVRSCELGKTQTGLIFLNPLVCKLINVLISSVENVYLKLGILSNTSFPLCTVSLEISHCISPNGITLLHSPVLYCAINPNLYQLYFLNPL